MRAWRYLALRAMRAARLKPRNLKKRNRHSISGTNVPYMFALRSRGTLQIYFDLENFCEKSPEGTHSIAVCAAH